jgi:hypothetical protein
LFDKIEKPRERGKMAWLTKKMVDDVFHYYAMLVKTDVRYYLFDTTNFMEAIERLVVVLPDNLQGFDFDDFEVLSDEEKTEKYGDLNASVMNLYFYAELLDRETRITNIGHRLQQIGRYANLVRFL